MANRIAHFNPSSFRNFPGYTIMSKAILCCVSFACNKMQNQIFELPEVRKSVLFLKGFQTGKRQLARFKEHQVSECHKIAIDYETNLSRTCRKMCGKCPLAVMQQKRRWSLTVQTCIRFIKVIECLQYLARQGQAMQGNTDDESNFIQLLIN